MDGKASRCRSEPRNIVIACESVYRPTGWQAPQEPQLLPGPLHSAWHTVGLGTNPVSGRETPVLYKEVHSPIDRHQLQFLLAVFYSYPGLMLFSVKVFLAERGSPVPS